MPEAVSSPRGSRRLRLYPLLVALWPVVSLYGQNAGEVPLYQALQAMGVVAALTLAVNTALTLLLRDGRRAGLVTSLLALSVLLAGHASNVLTGARWLPFVWAAVTAIGVALLVRARAPLDHATRVVAIVAATLVLVGLAPVVQDSAALASATYRNAHLLLPQDVPGWQGAGEPRDIYYLILDRYGSKENLRRRFGWDNQPFLDELKRRGFFVADGSIANHLRTAQSLASSLNLRYVNDLQQRYGPDTSNLLPVYEMLADHTVGRVLRGHGYHYVHIGAWWDPTGFNRFADINLGYEPESDFLTTLWDTTLVGQLRLREERSGEVRRHGAYQGTLQQLEALRQTMSMEGPTFVFAHVLLPHQPFVFDAEGNYQSLADDYRRGHDRGYTEQLAYTNKRILELVDQLQSVPEDEQPIILIQADEGPHPITFLRDEDAYDWTRAPDDDLYEKMAILNALYLPEVAGVRQPQLYETQSPVNTWRMLFNSYFGAELPLLEDRSYIFRSNAHVYDFADVTARLRRIADEG